MKMDRVELYEIEYEEDIHHYILECSYKDGGSIFEGYKFYSREVRYLIPLATKLDSIGEYGRYTKCSTRKDAKLITKHKSPMEFVELIQTTHPELFI
ncbi:hypothetical protein WCWAEYFT_CDS0117 [Vibrio phage VB_VaC_TDDLMA]